MAIRTHLVAVIAFQCAALFGSQACAQNEPSFTDFPFLIHCEHSGIDRAFYLTKVDPDGVAIFISPDRQAGTITIHGHAERVGGDGSGSCSGKTLRELRAAGQAFDLR